MNFYQQFNENFVNKYIKENVDNSNCNMKIEVESGINGDGFSVTIMKNGSEVFKKKYDYGYNASWNKAFVNDKEPYVSDIINDLKVKYDVDQIEVVESRNVFTGKNISQRQVKEFENRYL